MFWKQAIFEGMLVRKIRDDVEAEFDFALDNFEGVMENWNFTYLFLALQYLSFYRYEGCH